MLSYKAAEPLAQSACLFRDDVQFTGHRSRLQFIECVRWDKLRLSQPLQEAIAAVEPSNRRIDRRRDRVQEIEADRVGDENGRRSVLHGSAPVEGRERLQSDNL